VNIFICRSVAGILVQAAMDPCTDKKVGEIEFIAFAQQDGRRMIMRDEANTFRVVYSFLLFTTYFCQVPKGTGMVKAFDREEGNMKHGSRALTS
jgi:hypothetical protein